MCGKRDACLSCTQKPGRFTDTGLMVIEKNIAVTWPTITCGYAFMNIEDPKLIGDVLFDYEGSVNGLQKCVLCLDDVCFIWKIKYRVI